MNMLHTFYTGSTSVTLLQSFFRVLKKYELYDDEWNFTKRGVNAY